MMHVGNVYLVREVLAESIGRYTYVRPTRPAYGEQHYLARCPCGWSGPFRRFSTPLAEEQARWAARADAVAHVDRERFDPDRSMTA